MVFKFNLKTLLNKYFLFFIMEYIDSINKSWIEILMEPSSKIPLIFPKTTTLKGLFNTLEGIRKLNASFDDLKINFYELELIPLQNAIFDHKYEEVEKLKREIKSKLTKYVSETELEKMLSKYISLIRKLNSYTLGDLYKIEQDIERMDDEDFDDIFSKDNILEGLNDIIEAIRQEGIVEKDIGDEQNIASEFKEIYDKYYFEVVKAKNIVDFLSTILD